MKLQQSYLRRPLLVLLLVLLMLAISVPAVFAADPPFTVVGVIPPRTDPPPIPHTDVLDTNVTLEFITNEIRPQSIKAQASAAAQGVSGKEGVFQTTTSISNGIYLYPGGSVCNDFNIEHHWQGETWTNYFGGWGPFAADDGYFQAKNVTFDREQVVGPGNDFGANSASMKIASNQPYDAGVMSPPIPVKPGDEVTVFAYYLIYNHNDHDGLNFDYASLGVLPGEGAKGKYALGYHRGEWSWIEKTVVATGDFVQVMLQAHSPAALNSNVYFDDIEVYVNGSPVADCRG